jgi:hypothetical protein
METKNILFEVNVSLAESYLYGIAKGTRGTYAINIQGGRTGVMLPKELLSYDRDSYAEALLNIRTKSETLSLRSKVDVGGGDMIEIFDDRLLDKLATEEPRAMEILLLEDDGVPQ